MINTQNKEENPLLLQWQSHFAPQNKEGNPLLLQWQSHFAPQNKEDFMLDKMIGFIGAGNMGSAMIGGILDASLVTTSQIIASAHSPETLDKLSLIHI